MLIPLLLGLAIGLILALTGADGGILAVPLLIFGTRISVAQAGPIGLMAVGMAATLGAVLGLRAAWCAIEPPFWWPGLACCFPRPDCGLHTRSTIAGSACCSR